MQRGTMHPASCCCNMGMSSGTDTHVLQPTKPNSQGGKGIIRLITGACFDFSAADIVESRVQATGEFSKTPSSPTWPCPDYHAVAVRARHSTGPSLAHAPRGAGGTLWFAGPLRESWRCTCVSIPFLGDNRYRRCSEDSRDLAFLYYIPRRVCPLIWIPHKIHQHPQHHQRQYHHD